MTYQKYRERILNPHSKKRILALDGGGIRGLITVQLLKKLEKIIQEKSNNPNARLRDYFDLIGGTSTGAIIAGAITIGKTASELDEIYRDVGRKIFKRSLLRWGIFRSRFDEKAINAALKEHFGDMTMEDTTHEGVALAIISKRIDTGSVWVTDNNPEGKYYNYKEGANKDYILRKIIRASTAAPMYFNAERIRITPEQIGEFVDGGVSPHNNPALQLFMLATINGYQYNWKKGVDNLFILSLGTGSWCKQSANNINNRYKFNMSAKDAVTSLLSIMDDADELNRQLLQWMGKATGEVSPIDSIIGTLENETLSPEPMFSYMRYDPTLEKDWLADKLGLNHYNDKDICNIRKMDATNTMDMLTEIGKRYAEKMIKAEHID